MVVRESFDRHKRDKDDEIRNSLLIATAILNWGGPRSKKFRAKPLGYLYEKLADRSANNWTREEVRDEYEAIRERSLARKRRRVERGELPPGEEMNATDPDT